MFLMVVCSIAQNERQLSAATTEMACCELNFSIICNVPKNLPDFVALICM